MIGRIRDVVSGWSDKSDMADSEWELEPEIEESGESDIEGMVQEPQPVTSDNFTSGNLKSDSEYFKSVVTTSIAQKGRFGGYEISVWWLKTILAGLEGKESYLEKMWKGGGYADAKSIDDVLT